MKRVRSIVPLIGLLAVLMGIVLLAAGPRATLAAPTSCSGATAGDNAIISAELFHNDTQVAYRDPVGSVDKDASATVRLRACKDDVQSVELLVWETGAGATPTHVYTAVVGSSDADYDYWEYDVPGPGVVVDQWYQFRVTDGTAVGHFYVTTPNSGPGTWVAGAATGAHSWSLPTAGSGNNNGNPGPDYTVPSWIEDAVIYQIFPDRFRNGNTSNDPVDGTAVYEPGGCDGYPHDRPGGATSGCLQDIRSWNDPLLIPSWGLDFYGGDLQGVIDKINDGYFTDLGVNTLYFNPIFEASSNHGYETNDYYNVRSFFGDNALFDQLVATADAHNIRIILDGVFNHMGMDSKYLDPYNRYASVTGACESAGSSYRSWFTPGDKGTAVCDGGWGWTGWYGYETLPELVDDSAGVREFFFRGGTGAEGPNGESVSQYWLDKGIAGWRYDVAQDITHDFFADMRPYIKGTNTSGTVYGDSDYLMLGEVTGGCDWNLYASYINENELDSVMNYCFRDWAKEFGNGDAPSQFDSKYNSFRALFPESPWKGFMNLISSHDSPRMMNLLGNQSDKLKLVTLLQMTLPGAPSVYYGDEIGMTGGGDPDNRRPYPWTGSNGDGDTADTGMYNHFKTAIGIRNTHSALRGGDVKTLLVDDASGVYSYLRWDTAETIVVALNNKTTAAAVSIPVAGDIPDGTVLTDLLNGGTVTVSGGAVSVTVDGRWGVILQGAAVEGDYDLTITVDPLASGGAVTADPPPAANGKYVDGTVVTLTASPDQDYACKESSYWRFEQWSGDASGTTATVTVMMDGNKSVTAEFLEHTPPVCPRYSITTAVDPVASGGAITLDPLPGVDGKYDAGTVVTVTASPAENPTCGPTPYWTFTSWSGDLSGSSASTSLTLNADATITANFQQITPPQCPTTPDLDGVRDAGYATAVGTDSASDLNSSIAGWSGTAWTELTNLYCTSDDTDLYVFADLPGYSQSTSSGQIGLLLDVGDTAVGGTTDPWGNAIDFAHTSLPDYLVRGNIPGISGNPPDDNNGWTELRDWTGSAWGGAAVNWGGLSGGALSGGAQVGTHIAYADGEGVEFKIPLSAIGAAAGDTVNLELFATQTGATKGAYDTVPDDDQSTGWDDATTLSAYAACVLGSAPQPAISISPTSLSSTQETNTQATATLTIGNSGGADLTWTISEATGGCATTQDSPWLSAAPASGTTSPSSSTAVTVTFDAAGLAADTYSHSLCVASNDPTTPQVELPVTLTVTEPGDAVIAYEPVDGVVDEGDTLDVDLNITDVTGLYGVDVTLTFDPAVVQVVDADAGTPGVQVAPGTCPDTGFIVTNSADNSAGTIQFIGTTLNPTPACDGSGTMLTVTFQGTAVGTANLGFGLTELSTAGGAPITHTTQDGSLTVEEANGMISGSAFFQGRTDHSGAVVAAWDGALEVATAVTDASGAYALTVPAGTYTITVEGERMLDAERTGVVVAAGDALSLPDVTLLAGDATDDDIINIFDLSVIGAQYGNTSADPAWDARADMNDDGSIDIFDLTPAGANYTKGSPVPWS